MNRSFLSNRKLSAGQVILSLLITFPQARADQHVLSIQEMHEAAVEATMEREANQADIDRFLQNDKVKEVRRTQRINEPEVRKAIPWCVDGAPSR
jgi:hypothetical protein